MSVRVALDLPREQDLEALREHVVELYDRHRQIYYKGYESSIHYAIKRYLMHQMDLYAQLACRRICRATSQKLPRELRDQIYLHVHGQAICYIAPGCRGKGLPRFLRDVEDLLETEITMRTFFDHSPHLAYCKSRDLTLAHYFNRKYVGRTTQKEIVQSWFRTGVFQIGDVRVVREFLGNEWKAFGIRPADHICRVELSVYDPSDALDKFDRTHPIETDTLFEEFKAVAPTNRTNITVVSRMDPGDFSPDWIKVIETTDFEKMMRQIYEARVKGHRVLKVNLQSHGGIQFDAPVAQAVEWRDWYKCAMSNLQRAGTEHFNDRSKYAKRVGFSL